MLSYLTIFTIILAGFALVVHVAFAAILEREASAHLAALARVGETAVDWTRPASGSTQGMS